MTASLPKDWLDRLDLPLVVAPMFLVSTVEMVTAACQEGVIGSIPTVNARTPEILDGWLDTLTRHLSGVRGAAEPAPWALNLVVHSTNTRLPDDLALCVQYEAPLVITALGSPKAVVADVHRYGGLVFADVSTPTYARKAIEAGADGLVLVSAGAGGHTGQIAAPAFLAAVREFWDGLVIVAGGLMNGSALRAAQIMGADLAYMGTRFIAATESAAAEAYKDMVVACGFDDLVYTNAITGAFANKLRPSLVAAGLDPDDLKPRGRFDMGYAKDQPKAWKDIWSAGQGVGQVKAIEPMAAIIARLKLEYAATLAREIADPRLRRLAAAERRVAGATPASA